MSAVETVSMVRLLFSTPETAHYSVSLVADDQVYKQQTHLARQQ